MANISKQAIKRIVKRCSGAAITDDGAEELAKVLEKQASKIADFAVKNAKKDGRSRIVKDDVRRYAIVEGD